LPAKTRAILIRSQEVLAVVIFLLFVVLVFIFSNEKIWISALLVAVSAVPIVLAFNIHKNKLKRIVLVIVIVAGTLNLYCNAELFPKLFNYQGTRQALAIYEQNRNEKDTLVNLQLEEYELFFWAKTPVENFSTWENFYSFLKKEGSWVYTNQRGYEVVMELSPKVVTVYVISQRGMNEITLPFLLPKTRESALRKNYLIKVK